MYRESVVGTGEGSRSVYFYWDDFFLQKEFQQILTFSLHVEQFRFFTARAFMD